MALSDQAEVNEGQVALFYWDPFANSWAELTGSEFVKVSVSTLWPHALVASFSKAAYTSRPCSCLQAAYS